MVDIDTLWTVDAQTFPVLGSFAEKAKFLISYAILAPSAHNTQPWSFLIEDYQISIYPEESRKLKVSDPEGRQLALSLGAALAHLRIAAEFFDMSYQIELYPISNCVARLTFAKASQHETLEKKDTSLLDAIPDRSVNRAPFLSKKIAKHKLRKIQKSFDQDQTDCELTFVSSKSKISSIGGLVEEAVLNAMSAREFRLELAHWLRHNWTQRPDGIPGYVMDMPSLPSLLIPALVQADETIAGAAKDEGNSVSNTANLAVISVAEDNEFNWLQAGEASERMILELTKQGLVVSYHTALIESSEQRSSLQELLELNGLPVMVLRVGYPKSTYRHTPRWSVDDVSTDLTSDTVTNFETNLLISEQYQAPVRHVKQRHASFLDWYQKFDIDTYNALTNLPEEEITERSQKRALSIFHACAEYVPAYKDFLQQHRVNPNSIQTIDDFHKVPVIDKKNYISQYSIDDLTFGGNVANKGVISFSSGSSGKPYYWPRGVFHQTEGALIYEHFMNQLFDIKQKSTLAVVAFSMGAYVAGTYTLASLQQMQAKGYEMTIVSPGIDVDDTIKLIRELAPSFDQVMLCGYPPFIKDLLDEGLERDLRWDNHDVKFFLASDFFTETWRDHVLGLVGKDSSHLRDITNIYGTADATVFGHETPFTTLLRKMSAEDLEFHRSLFSSSLNPTFVQYNPLLRYFEKVNDELVLTASSGIPLVRYNLHDQGGLMLRSELDDFLDSRNLSLNTLAERYDLTQSLNNLPYLYITSRTDGAASLYGVLIYPDFVRTVVESEDLQAVLTGKFSMETVSNSDSQIQELHIYVEMKKGVSGSSELSSKLTERIIANLRLVSAEYQTLSEKIDEKAIPHVHLVERGNKKYFAKKIKQKWIQS